jgi:hypothetical protein
MPVYVDNARNSYGRMIMCHMVADRIVELMGMADRIGLARRHFQPGSFPHFDLSLAYRDRALRHGAILVDRRELVSVMRAYRELLLHDDTEMEQLRTMMNASRERSRRP